MDVDYAPLPVFDESSSEQPHEPGQTHKIDVLPFKCCLQRAFKRGAILAECRVVDNLGGDAGGMRDQKAADIRPIGNNQDDLGRIVLVFCSLDQSRHVGAASGDENGDPFATHASPEIEFAVISDTCVAARADDVAEHHHSLACARKSFNDCVRFLR